MKERPILFSAPMVLALLAGTKTQTRRVAKEFAGRDDLDKILRRFPNQNGCPYGVPGDRLWVRESWAPNSGSAGGFLYRADHGSASSYHRIDLKTGVWTHAASRWRPSIHMPRSASRITLEITGVRVERLQDISDPDALAEGCSHNDMLHGDRLASVYARLWEKINGPGSWAKNPYVWVVEFKRVQQASSGRPLHLEGTPCNE
ncbi:MULTISPECIES: hypothetical protein [Delftia]|uniref:ASCH domain-containing protein n=1 Tax=Delftia lacustris TaxID=558537 RepID=A0A7T2YXH9_9BURK|nr:MULTISPECIES: hypothetical protein [Delftia]EPD35865.1 hypothetical protein HMPREF9702_05772 [Delftia acidovorans CCUG 15835]QPS83530.1 hypothetical protein I6G47_10875 [Delftia lacustris]